ncbi:MAG TPA: beta-ketoacyl synthase N-terminal-like domain-containing protein [Cytophagaceae bacterium]|jgi:3-oxoacyl-[acyl-carrier-protein] synthase-1|nr:beta-ketoacyl synthase N-terminal-like domain-containing protein [Cytophagaceae bacterium]
MKDVFITANNIISPLGFTTEENYINIKKGISGIKKTDSLIPPYEPIYISRIEDKLLEEKALSINNANNFTKVEKLLLLSITDTLKQTKVDVKSEDFFIIISTTKGNIDLLEENEFPENRVYLWSLADTIQNYFGTAHKPLIISNACISGVNALIAASRFIRDGWYKNVLVAGVDILSPFVLSGFQSFKAISSNPCKPFDKNRDGINLGEACGTLLLSSEISDAKKGVKLLGGAVSNDANHISGPSRTGDGLLLAITNALKESFVSAKEIDFLNAHGTATLYNDEMESKAFKYAGLQNTPMNSLKGYFGHTLGAAGTIETIISIKSMLENEVLPTLGFQEAGTPETVNISNSLVKKNIHQFIKTASGFGGCNGAIVIQKL